MMRAAHRRFSVRAGVVVALIALASWVAWDYLAQREAHQSVRNLLGADLKNLPAARSELARHPRRTDSLLREELARETDPGRKLRLSLALVDTNVDYLYERLLTATPQEFGAIRDGLVPHKADVVERLRHEFANPEGNADHRFRAVLPRWSPTTRTTGRGTSGSRTSLPTWRGTRSR